MILLTISPGEAEMVRYAKSITINIALQAGTTQGVIYPPALNIEYATVTKEAADSGATADVRWGVLISLETSIETVD